MSSGGDRCCGKACKLLTLWELLGRVFGGFSCQPGGWPQMLRFGKRNPKNRREECFAAKLAGVMKNSTLTLQNAMLAAQNLLAWFLHSAKFAWLVVGGKVGWGEERSDEGFGHFFFKLFIFNNLGAMRCFAHTG